MSPPLADLDPTRPSLRWLLRLPNIVYRANLGGLMGRRFVQLTVRGRRSGLPRQVVLEVIGCDATTGDPLVASGWGRRAQWFQNVVASPTVHARMGRRDFVGSAAVLDQAAAADALRAYARAHRFAYRWLIGPALLGRRPTGSAEEILQLASVLPILAIRSTRDARDTNDSPHRRTP